MPHAAKNGLYQARHGYRGKWRGKPLGVHLVYFGLWSHGAARLRAHTALACAGRGLLMRKEHALMANARICPKLAHVKPNGETADAN